MSDFDDWLRSWHQRMEVTPRRLVDEVVQRATSGSPTALERIVAGQVSEVYVATINDGDQVIVRISHEDEPRFEGERWALDAVRALGVPTPHVLHLECTGGVTFCIEEKLPGEPLDQILARGEWPAGAIEQIGALLARIHGVPIDGFGYLQAGRTRLAHQLQPPGRVGRAAGAHGRGAPLGCPCGTGGSRLAAAG